MPAPAPAWRAAPQAIALVAATYKTVLMIIPGATRPAIISEVGVTFDASGVMCLVEVVESTQAANGTTGTDFNASAKQVRGFVAGDTTAPLEGVRHTYTTEPTTLTVLENWYFSSGGILCKQYPLGREIQSLVSGATKYKGIGIRIKAASGINCYPWFEWE